MQILTPKNFLGFIFKSQKIFNSQSTTLTCIRTPTPAILYFELFDFSPDMEEILSKVFNVFITETLLLIKM